MKTGRGGSKAAAKGAGAKRKTAKRASAQGNRATPSAAMRKPKQPDQNRLRILEAAIAEFSERGFKGASMDAIAARTHTTRAMINYYFGGKEGCYRAVLEYVYRGIRAQEGQLDLEHLAPVDAIRRVVATTFQYYIDHPGFVNLVVAENQAKGRYLKQSKVMRSLNLPIIAAMRNVLARGQRDGVFRKDADPVELHMAISALGFFNMANQYTFGAIFRHPLGAHGNVRRRQELVTEIVLGYLGAR